MKTRQTNQIDTDKTKYINNYFANIDFLNNVKVGQIYMFCAKAEYLYFSDFCVIKEVLQNKFVIQNITHANTTQDSPQYAREITKKEFTEDFTMRRNDFSCEILQNYYLVENLYESLNDFVVLRNKMNKFLATEISVAVNLKFWHRMNREYNTKLEAMKELLIIAESSTYCLVEETNSIRKDIYLLEFPNGMDLNFPEKGTII